MRARPAPMKLTERAAERLRSIIAAAEKPVVGVRVGVRSRGCSGLSYTLEYAEERKGFEEEMSEKGVTLLIDPTAIMFLIGTEMDWVEEDLGARFVFNNPNEVDRCGCGESFRVAPQEAEAAGAHG